VTAHSTEQETLVLTLAANAGCTYSTLPDPEHIEDCSILVAGSLQQMRSFYEAGRTVDLW
jgi:hypothetical protein